MLSDSLGKVLGLAKGSVDDLGGSIATQLGNGVSSISGPLGKFADALATGSGQGDGGGK